MIYKGFTIYLKKKDVFVITDRKNKSETFIKNIIDKLNDNGFNIPCDLLHIDYVKSNLLKGYCTIKGDKNPYYDIYGDNFGGKGDFINTGNTVIIEI